MIAPTPASWDPCRVLQPVRRPVGPLPKAATAATMPGMVDHAEELADWRARVLDAAIIGQPVHPPGSCAAACTEWLATAVPAGGTSIGVACAGLPDDWRDTLAWAGVPLSAAGPLRWGVDLIQDLVDSPELRRGILHLPPPDALAQLTSLALKPLRMFVAERLVCRLQAAPGIRMWLWRGRAALQSQSPIPLAGFLYGSADGHRASIALDPWGCQVIDWPV